MLARYLFFMSTVNVFTKVRPCKPLTTLETQLAIKIV